MLILECTFWDLDQESKFNPEHAKLHGHIHIQDVLDAHAKGSLDHVGHTLLVHLSSRYTAMDICPLPLQMSVMLPDGSIR